MFNPFVYLREKAREAVLAGVHDALVQIDPGTAPPLPTVAAASPPALAAGPQAPMPESASEVGDDDDDTSSGSGETIQQRLARAAEGSGGTPQLPPAPSAPRRGRGRPPKGDAP